MNIFIRVVGEGKSVQVFDKIANQVAYDGFLELADGSVALEVASRDGSTGLIDITKGRLRRLTQSLRVTILSSLTK